MNKTIIGLVLTTMILGAVAFWLVKKGDSKASAAFVGEYSVSNADDIQKIYLVFRSGEKVLLSRAGDHWMVDDTYTADPAKIKNILHALTKMRVYYAPAEALKDQMSKSLATIGIKVEVIGADDKLLNAFYVGGVTNDEEGTYMIKEGSNDPQIVHLPGHVGGLRYWFTIPSEKWRSKIFVQEDPDQIASIKMDYPTLQSRSFLLDVSTNNPSVTPLYPGTPIINAPLKNGAVKSYLTQFESLVAEAYENNSLVKDSILQNTPLAILTIQRKDGTSKYVQYFPFFSKGSTNKELRAKDKDPKSPFGLFRYYLDVNGKDFMLGQHSNAGRCMWAYQSFFERIK